MTSCCRKYHSLVNTLSNFRVVNDGQQVATNLQKKFQIYSVSFGPTICWNNPFRDRLNLEYFMARVDFQPYCTIYSFYLWGARCIIAPVTIISSQKATHFRICTHFKITNLHIRVRALRSVVTCLHSVLTGRYSNQAFPMFEPNFPDLDSRFFSLSHCFPAYLTNISSSRRLLRSLPTYIYDMRNNSLNQIY